jgi:hypothetical protein
MVEIDAAETSELNRYRMAAKESFYGSATKAMEWGWWGSLAFAVLGPVALFAYPDAGSYVGAGAGLWIFITRLGLEPLARERKLNGVCAQEAFDCDVLGIDWNRSLAAPLAPEEIRGAAGEVDFAAKRDSWYPVGEPVDWPTSVLICQRSNAVWAWRQHRSFSHLLKIAAIALAGLGVVFALAEGASLGRYLVTLGLPSLPAALELIELIGRHRWAAERRQQTNEELEALIARGDARAIQIREFQDQLFLLRRDEPNVPERFYRHVREDYERDMRFGASQMNNAASGGA